MRRSASLHLLRPGRPFWPMRRKVYLVGAGPGNPGLLTVEAREALRRADVILYDRLVDRRVLGLRRKGARKVYVGAGRDDPQRRQERICRLMRKYHDEGLNVVRLKNGDPFIFGRGGEEMDFLRRNRIGFKVVPGVTSAVGVPTSAGLPLTSRGVSSGVMILSGHLADGLSTDWSGAAKFRGTVVVLMGADAAGEICRKLLELGKDPSTPACMISRGTLRGEKIVSGRLSDLGALVEREKLTHPAIAVIGDAVKLAGFWRG